MAGSWDSERAIVITVLSLQPASTLEIAECKNKEPQLASRIGSSTDRDKLPMALFSKSHEEFTARFSKLHIKVITKSKVGSLQQAQLLSVVK